MVREIHSADSPFENTSAIKAKYIKKGNHTYQYIQINSTHKEYYEGPIQGLTMYAFLLATVIALPIAIFGALFSQDYRNTWSRAFTGKEIVLIQSKPEAMPAVTPPLSRVSSVSNTPDTTMTLLKALEPAPPPPKDLSREKALIEQFKQRLKPQPRQDGKIYLGDDTDQTQFNQFLTETQTNINAYCVMLHSAPGVRGTLLDMALDKVIIEQDTAFFLDVIMALMELGARVTFNERFGNFFKDALLTKNARFSNVLKKILNSLSIEECAALPCQVYRFHHAVRRADNDTNLIAWIKDETQIDISNQFIL
jgi:hypothetical protein